MTIFVTGATGLIGSFICRRLIENGYVVRALRRASSALSLVDDISDQITWVEGDILDTVALAEQLAGADGVIHCAALVSYDSRDETRMHKVNVEGTANLVNASLRLGIAYFLHVSSVAAIGRGKAENKVDETHQANAEEFSTAYARSKHLAELEVWRASSEGLPVAIINPSLVLGPGEWSQGSTKIFKYIWDENRFYINGLANYVDVRDVATVALRLLKSQVTGERFITSAGSIPYAELFGMVARAFSKKPPATRVNPNLIPLASLADSFRARLTGRPQLITNELKQIASNTHIFDNTKVQQTTGITFNPLENTVRWCCHELAKKNQMVQS